MLFTKQLKENKEKRDYDSGRFGVQFEQKKYDLLLSNCTSGVQTAPQTSASIRGISSPEDRREIHPHGHNNLACWIINLLLDVLLRSIAENFYSLLVF